MTFPPPVRKFLLTMHVAVSVGWLGAIGAYIALNVPAVASTDPQTVRAAYLMMEPVALYGIAPLSVATLLTGIVQSLGTPWGLFRHYWVVVSLVVTLVATAVLLEHMDTVRALSEMARDPNLDMLSAGGDLFHSIGGLIVLLVPLWLNMYKPRGLTRYGWRRQQRRKPSERSLVDAEQDWPRSTERPSLKVDMPTDEARIPTPRAERYLAQLTSHTGHMKGGHLGGRRHHDRVHVAPGVQQVSQSGNRAVITFDWGVCTAIAEPDGLTLRLEAQNPADLERARDLLTRRVRTIGRREDLTVAWHPKDDASS